MAVGSPSFAPAPPPRIARRGAAYRRVAPPSVPAVSADPMAAVDPVEPAREGRPAMDRACASILHPVVEPAPRKPCAWITSVPVLPAFPPARTKPAGMTVAAEPAEAVHRNWFATDPNACSQPPAWMTPDALAARFPPNARAVSAARAPLIRIVPAAGVLLGGVYPMTHAAGARAS